MKNFQKKSIILFIIKNILAAIVLVTILIWITFRAIDKYTEHGVAEKVPDLRGAYMEEAEILLAAQGLYPKVIDSVFMRDKKLGTIVEQIPQPNATIKHNRPVYLIINSREVRQIALPAVNDFSSRQASSMLKAGGLNVDSIEYVPSEYKDLVIDVKYKGESIPAGTKIPEGESVTLVVGQGRGTEKIIVPKLKGLMMEDARMEIVASSLIPGAMHYDEKTGANEDYFVYRQEPMEGNIVSSGTTVNLWFTTDTLLLKQNEHQGTYINNQDEEFF